MDRANLWICKWWQHKYGQHQHECDQGIFVKMVRVDYWCIEDFVFVGKEIMRDEEPTMKERLKEKRYIYIIT